MVDAPTRAGPSALVDPSASFNACGWPKRARHGVLGRAGWRHSSRTVKVASHLAHPPPSAAESLSPQPPIDESTQLSLRDRSTRENHPPSGEAVHAKGRDSLFVGEEGRGRKIIVGAPKDSSAEANWR